MHGMLMQVKKGVFAQKLVLAHQFLHVEVLAGPSATVPGGAAHLLRHDLAPARLSGAEDFAEHRRHVVQKYRVCRAPRCRLAAFGAHGLQPPA